MTELRGTLTRADFVEAASRFIDEHGLEALTMRALGKSLDVDGTALYRHFPAKNDLLVAVVDGLVGDALALWEAHPDAADTRTPVERLRTLGMVSRQVFEAHPNLLAAVVIAGGDGPHSRQLTALTLALLEDLGLRDDDLVRAYLMLESVVMGVSMYDLSGAPYHLVLRQARLRAQNHPALDAACRSVEAVGQLNTAVFMGAYEAALMACQAMADRR